MYDRRMGDRGSAPIQGQILVIIAIFLSSACAARSAPKAIVAPGPAAVSPPGAPAPAQTAEEPSVSLRSDSRSGSRDQPASAAIETFGRSEHLRGPELSPDRETNGSWAIDELGPFRLESLGPRGSWVALCTGAGKDASLRLFAAESPAAVRLGLFGSIPRRIDRILGWSRDGRYLMTLEGVDPRLLDLELGTEADLAPYSPDLVSDAEADHRSVAFSDDGTELALLTTSGSIVVMPLPASGSQPKTLVPSRAPWRIRYSGSFLVSESGPGGIWPVPKRKSAPLRCTSSRTALSAFVRASEPSAAFSRETELWRRSARTAAFENAPGFVMTLGKGWVRREDDGRLLLVEGKTQKQLTSSRCGARIRYADSSRELLLVACEKYRPRPDPSDKKSKPKKPEYSFPLYLIGPSTVRELGFEDARASFDLGPVESAWKTQSSPELIPLTGSGQAIVVDLKSRTAHALDAGQRILTTSGRTALLRKGSRIARVEFSSGGAARDRKELPFEVEPFDPILSAGGYISVGVHLLHPTEEARSLRQTPVAITYDGAALEPTSLLEDWFEGPLLITRPKRQVDGRPPAAHSP